VTSIAEPMRSPYEIDTTGVRRVIPRARMLHLLFLSFPLWWTLGFENFMWPVLATPLLLSLVLRRSAVRMPRGFGIWLLFLLWVAISGTQIDSVQHAVSFAYRGLLYLSATVLFLYVYNASPRDLPARSIVSALSLYWAVIVGGGFLAIFFPSFTFHAPGAAVIPGALKHVDFVNAMLHPGFSQVQRILGFPVGRPRTFFVYTNEWGSNLAILTPFAFAAVAMARSRLQRRTFQLLLVAALVPVVVSLDRGTWLAIAIALGYAAIRFAPRSTVKQLTRVAAIAVLVGGIILVTPLGSLMADRFAHPHSDAGRKARDEAAIQDIKASPLLGYGTPRPWPPDPSGPSLGTHGQFFLVLFSNGAPGVLFFLAWFAFVLLRTGKITRAGPDARFWAHLAIISAIVQAAYYELLPMQLSIMMVAAALALRELQHPTGPKEEA
jgi:hypothetical protein